MVESKKRKRDAEHDVATVQEKTRPSLTFPAALPVRSKARPVVNATGEAGAQSSALHNNKRDWQTFATTGVAAGAGLDRDSKRPRLGDRIAASDGVSNSVQPADALSSGSAANRREILQPGVAELDGKPIPKVRSDSPSVENTGENLSASVERTNKRDWQEFAGGEKGMASSANAGGKRARLSDDGVAASSSHASSVQDAQPRSNIDQTDIASVMGTSVSGAISSRAASETRSMSGRDTGNSQVSSIPDAQPRSPIDHSDGFSMSGLTVSDAGSPRVASAARSVSGSDASTDYGSDFSPSEIARLDAKSNASSANGSTRYGSDWSEDTKARIIEKVDELAATRTAEWVNAQPKPASLPRGIEERQREPR